MRPKRIYSGDLISIPFRDTFTTTALPHITKSEPCRPGRCSPTSKPKTVDIPTNWKKPLGAPKTRDSCKDLYCPLQSLDLEPHGRRLSLVPIQRQNRVPLRLYTRRGSQDSFPRYLATSHKPVTHVPANTPRANLNSVSITPTSVGINCGKTPAPSRAITRMDLWENYHSLSDDDSKDKSKSVIVIPTAGQPSKSTVSLAEDELEDLEPEACQPEFARKNKQFHVRLVGNSSGKMKEMAQSVQKKIDKEKQRCKSPISILPSTNAFQIRRGTNIKFRFDMKNAYKKSKKSRTEQKAVSTSQHHDPQAIRQVKRRKKRQMERENFANNLVKYLDYYHSATEQFNYDPELSELNDDEGITSVSPKIRRLQARLLAFIDRLNEDLQMSQIQELLQLIERHGCHDVQLLYAVASSLASLFRRCNMNGSNFRAKICDVTEAFLDQVLKIAALYHVRNTVTDQEVSLLRTIGHQVNYALLGEADEKELLDDTEKLPNKVDEILLDAIRFESQYTALQRKVLLFKLLERLHATLEGIATTAEGCHSNLMGCHGDERVTPGEMRKLGAVSISPDVTELKFPSNTKVRLFVKTPFHGRREAKSKEAKEILDSV